MTPALIVVLIVIGFLLLVVLPRSLKMVQEYERAVIFRLGRSKGAKGPGLFFVIPLVDKFVKVNLQVIAVPVASQQVITRDNVTVTVDAVAYFQVADPEAAVVRINNWYQSSQLVAQTTLRAIVGRHELDQLLSERDRLDAELGTALDAQTHTWGIQVHRVEIRDVQLPDQMQRAMAKQAEAERERRGKIIAAEGELQASFQLAEAARTIASTPGALQLRQLQTMSEIAVENNKTIVVPVPTELLEALEAFTKMTLSSSPPAGSGPEAGASGLEAPGDEAPGADSL